MRRFTASATFVGPARVRLAVGTCVEFDVVGPSADVGATFTPRPAPGPCIQIVSGATVGFGDVTVGATSTAATETVLSNCSSGLDVDIFGSITQATRRHRAGRGRVGTGADHPHSQSVPLPPPELTATTSTGYWTTTARCSSNSFRTASRERSTTP